jgi:hypothetical protein
MENKAWDVVAHTRALEEAIVQAANAAHGPL